MSLVTRETIAASLYAVLDAAVGNVVGLVTSSRRLRHFTAVDPGQMPALFVCQVPEMVVRPASGAIFTPPIRTMRFEVWLYTADPQEDSIVPVQQLNAMVEAIENALAPDPMTGALTLGGQVKTARIEGSIEFHENLTNDGKSIAVIPVAVIRP
jgi:hypothetical protein